MRYSELGPRLARAYERAAELDLSSEPLLTSTHASIPACFLPEHLRDTGEQETVVESIVSSDGGGRAEWVKPPRCERCSVFATCRGFPRAYAERFGTDEVSPF